MNRGQSLFEVVVALAISALIIGGIVSLATNSIRNSTYSKNQSLAATYTQQATEWLRGQRDTDINTFIAKANSATENTWCLPDSALPADLANITTRPCTSDETITGTQFMRYVKFTFTTATSSPGTTVNLIEADITVSWTDSQGIHKVVSSTSFSDWRER